jgi:hypothetical protein
MGTTEQWHLLRMGNLLNWDWNPSFEGASFSHISQPRLHVVWTLAHGRSDDEESHQYARAKRSLLPLRICYCEKCANFGDSLTAGLCLSTEIRTLLFWISPSVAECGDGGVMPVSIFGMSMTPSRRPSRPQHVTGCCPLPLLVIPPSLSLDLLTHLPFDCNSSFLSVSSPAGLSWPIYRQQYAQQQSYREKNEIHTWEATQEKNTWHRLQNPGHKSNRMKQRVCAKLRHSYDTHLLQESEWRPKRAGNKKRDWKTFRAQTAQRKALPIFFLCIFLCLSCPKSLAGCQRNFRRLEGTRQAVILIWNSFCFFQF